LLNFKEKYVVMSYNMALRPDEWLDLSAVERFSMANIASINSFPSDLFGNGSVDYDPSDGEIDLVDIPELSNVPKAREDSNFQRIQSIMQGDSTMLVEELAEYRVKLQKERDQLANIVGDDLKPKHMTEYVKNGVRRSGFVFDNFRGLQEIQSDQAKLEEFVNMMLEYYKTTSDYSEQLKRKVDNHTVEELVRDSLYATLYWPRIDLNLAGLYTPEALARLATQMLTSGKTFKPKSNPEVKKLFENFFAIYIDDSGYRDQYVNELELKGFDHTKVMSPADAEEVETLKDEQLHNVVKGSLGGAKPLQKEFLVVLLDALFDQLEDNLILALTELIKYMKKADMDGRRIDFITNALKDNIRMFRHLCRSQLVNHYDIQLHEQYPVMDGSKSKVPKKIPLGLKRLLGEIDNSTYLQADKYPLVLGGSGFDHNDTTERLYNFFVNNNKDVVNLQTKKPLALGGFILKDPIATIAMSVLYEYFKRLLGNKKRNITIISRILQKVSKGVKKSDVKRDGRELQALFKNIKGEPGARPDPTAQRLYGLNAVKHVQSEYQRRRKLELRAAKEMYEHLKEVEAGKVSTDQISKISDRILVRLAHYQLSSRIYRRLAEAIYTDMATDDGLPGEYLAQMETAFDAVDDNVLESINDAEISEGMKVKLQELLMKNVDEPINIDIDIALSSASEPSGTTIAAVKTTTVEKKKRYKSDTSTKPRLSEEQKRKIATRAFWEKVQQKLVSRFGVKTVYVPFVSDGLVVDSHGLLDLIDAAISGKVGSEHLIYGRKVTKKSLGKRYAAKGKLMVANDDAEVDHPDHWRAIDFKKMVGYRTEGPLRMLIYELLSNKVDYGIVMGNYRWPSGSSMTKIKVLKFCHTERPYKELPSDCSFLISRQTLGKNLGSIEGVPFR